MKNRSTFFICTAIFLTLNFCAKAIDADPAWVKLVGSKKMPAKTTVFKVLAYGAVNNGTTLNTSAIQKAIDACSAKGGGIVSFAPGKYLTGSIFLKKNVRLQIDKGVELLGSQNLDDYPQMDTRIAGIEMKWPAALINIIDQENVAVTGEGLVNAQGKPFWDKYWNMRKEYDPKGLRWIVDYDAQRPRTLLISGSSNITIKAITLQQAGFWTVQVLYSKYVTVDGIIVRNNIDGHGPSTDGIDVDSSTYVLIQNCDIDCNDDDFCLKAGRDWDGLRVNKPTEYVVIRYCISRAGGGLLTLGSETSGGIRHVLATNLSGNGTGNGLNIKSATTRGGTVEDIHFKNITMNNIGNAIQITMNWNPAYSYSKLPDGYDINTVPAHWKKMLTHVEPAEKGIPTFKDVYISNINIKGAKKAINAVGMQGHPLVGFHFSNVNIEANVAGDISYASLWTFDKVIITAKDGGKVNIKESAGLSM
ncbi:glycoside hydrolase family 28 protein [Mucilaginibacter paludis]|uniref:Glycoside hydrolase family 28 n=1 Tax=Mucilaginibacter paludis DSM 18603 TaxID=714943 RepID=H1Y0W3_9SPHI|nr:glycoside hydrolase family 28 protein [Mucilaginibacter paludis]EHQ29188.1 glycoside hydrolase family 28 [Mucilaginibacter paludis DSM 18603]